MPRVAAARATISCLQVSVAERRTGARVSCRESVSAAHENALTRDFLQSQSGEKRNLPNLATSAVLDATASKNRSWSSFADIALFFSDGSSAIGSHAFVRALDS